MPTPYSQERRTELANVWQDATNLRVKRDRHFSRSIAFGATAFIASFVVPNFIDLDLGALEEWVKEEAVLAGVLASIAVISFYYRAKHATTKESTAKAAYEKDREDVGY